MNEQITKTPLEEMRLPELQARYAEAFGEATKCPNRRWLIRKLEGAAAQGPIENEAPTNDTTTITSGGVQPAEADHDTSTEPAQDPAEPAPAPRPRLTKLSVPELQALFAEVIGKPTSSESKPYLVHRLRQAYNHKLPARPPKAEPAFPREFKVLPLRLEADFVAQIDEAWKRMGLRSRTELFRRAVGEWLERDEASSASQTSGARE